MVDTYRKQEKQILLLDAGMAFSHRQENQELKAFVVLKAMDCLRYDAMNLGSLEFSLGKKFLEKARSEISFPLLSSNLMVKETGKPWGVEYVAKQMGGLTVAVLGVLPADGLVEHQAAFPGLVIVPPEEALRKLVPRVRKKVDVVVVLSSCGYLDTVELVGKVPGIDLAVSSGRLASTIIKEDKPPVYQAGMKGERIGAITLTVTAKGTVTCGHELIELYDWVESNKEVDALVEDALKGIQDSESKNHQ